MKKEHAFYALPVVIILIAVNMFGRSWFPAIPSIGTFEWVKMIGIGLVIATLAGYLTFMISGYHYTRQIPMPGGAAGATVPSYAPADKERAARNGLVIFFCVWIILLTANLFGALYSALILMGIATLIAFVAYLLPSLASSGFATGHAERAAADTALAAPHDAAGATTPTPERTRGWSLWKIVAIVLITILVILLLGNIHPSAPAQTKQVGEIQTESRSAGEKDVSGMENIGPIHMHRNTTEQAKTLQTIPMPPMAGSQNQVSLNPY